jgi:predicted DsbA family dithiol-disulfide isomerase
VLVDCKPADDWEVAGTIGAEAGGLEKGRLLECARAAATEERMRGSTAEFHALKVTQRPTFVIDSTIGDRAVFSGFAKATPLMATVDSMLEDLEAYAAHAAHFGEPPAE